MRKQRGKEVEALDIGEPPEELAHVLRWFQDLSGARVSTGFGIPPITYTELSAWSRMTGNQPTPFEVAAIKRLDRLYLSVMSK